MQVTKEKIFIPSIYRFVISTNVQFVQTSPFRAIKPPTYLNESHKNRKIFEIFLDDRIFSTIAVVTVDKEIKK